MKQMNVYPECNVDTNLIGYLLGGHAMHKSTCNEVVKAMNNIDHFAVGIIDADKRMPTMDIGFKKYCTETVADGNICHIAMYIHDDGKRYIFTVKPAMDKFILDAAKEQNVDLEAAGYPSKLEDFKKETKRIQAADDPKLRRLFDMIKDNQEFQRFRYTLKYLMTKQYNSDSNIAKQFFDGTIGKEELKGYLI